MFLALQYRQQFQIEISKTLCEDDFIGAYAQMQDFMTNDLKNNFDHGLYDSVKNVL